ncbi:hypothetical protein GF068_02730 [Polyangium spumosum]|uniref:Secreted protein n=1 Tax=Polyangium spumosum TaxID=889282 RepID=A0A6N7PFG5_9BACT|nr:hypothetical protein [Polyangium spumosum]
MSAPFASTMTTMCPVFRFASAMPFSAVAFCSGEAEGISRRNCCRCMPASSGWFERSSLWPRLSSTAG